MNQPYTEQERRVLWERRFVFAMSLLWVTVAFLLADSRDNVLVVMALHLLLMAVLVGTEQVVIAIEKFRGR